MAPHAGHHPRSSFTLMAAPTRCPEPPRPLPAALNPHACLRPRPQVTILFTDIAGFTSMSRQVDPAEVMAFLNQLYVRYDQLLDRYNVYKVTSFFFFLWYGVQ